MNSITDQIRTHAMEIGFSKVGIARAESLTEEASQLRQWLHNDYQGTMRWMETKFQQRVDPREILSGARSLIVVALNYQTPYQHSLDKTLGKISRYAWGDDYHDVLKQRLDRLNEFIKRLVPESEGKVYVDTGPVMEKVWAQRAGIGWEGKHTNVITPEYGSWVFLGEIISTLVLECDEPATDHCGTCTLCIEACPTQAIVQPYVVDANRCISYLTIEHRGDMPDEFAERLDGWLYGCDICQDVCPWNHKFSQSSDLKEFRPREEEPAIDLSDVVHMGQEDFQERFRRSPIKRTKLSGLQRNARAIAQDVTDVASS